VCAAGACTHPAKPNGASCSDSLFCTINDTCQGGVCSGGGPNCTQYAQPCKAAGCDERRRNCYLTIKPNNTPCGDADDCNGINTCQKGTCAAAPPPDCNDHNPCTTDSCVPGVGCVHNHVADGTSCSDGVFCNGEETCTAGKCAAPPTPVCDDGNTCTTDVCVEKDKRCRHDGLNGCCETDADCADADACTTNERCEAGQCKSDPLVCQPTTELCHETTCDPTRGCVSSSVRDGTGCDDGDPCTQGESCSAGVCGMTLAKLGRKPLGGLAVTKFVLQPAGKHGLRVTAEGYFSADGPVDPTASGARLEIHSSAGKALFELDLPGSIFKANSSRTRFVVVPARGTALAAAGLKRLQLRLDGPTVDVSLKGLLPATVADVAPTRASAAAGADDPTVAWALWLGDSCVSDPSLRCEGKSSAKRCR
jgi:hypothetical protein